jgi:hypothetical protein
MKMELEMVDEFGAHLADGDAAAQFRLTRIEPYVSLCEELTLDFTGVRNANSSFMNALISGVVEQHGEIVLQKLVFKGCNPLLRVFVEGAIDLGIQKINGRVDA